MNTSIRRFAQATVAAVAVVATIAATPGPVPAAEAASPGLVPQPDLIAQTFNDLPADRYEMANGCYTLESATGGFVTRADGGWVATADGDTAERFHFRATDLGSYLLYAPDRTFLAVEQGPKEQLETGAEPVTGRLPINQDTDLPRSIDDDLPAGTSLAANDDVNTIGSATVVADAPSPAADWSVDRNDDGSFTFTLPATGGVLTAAADGTLATATAAVTDPAAQFALRLAEGCTDYPEIQVNVTGAPHGGETPFAETRGYVDAHLHTMAYEFLGGRARCGRPWHRYGVEYALVDCPDHEPGGWGAALEMAVSGKFGEPHDTTGWPTFTDWPAHDSLTHEGVYYKWLERAWRGGLRMMTTLLVDNNVLCEIYPYKQNSCNEMDGVRLQAQRLHEFQDYIDAQSGGPGEGWFQIVDSPFEAREVVNSGKLAVVMGIEVSVLFDCGEYLGMYRCTEEDIDQQMNAVHDLGVRQMELVNKFDNALSGVAGDGGATGVLVNNGNKSETGHYWKMQTCPEEGHDHNGHDRQQYNLIDGAEGQAPPDYPGRDELAGLILQQFGPTGVAPVYPAGDHCNTIGLTGLGRYVLDEMVERGMLFDPDHMSALARAQAMDHMRERGYHGVVSSHSWADDETYQEVYELGGMVTPMQSRGDRFVDTWKKHKSWANPDYYFGIGYGADMNGFAGQSGPRGANVPNPVTYPFTGIGGVVIDKNVAGERVYDLNVDGVAHYGLYPDWVEDAAINAGDRREEFLEDMARGVEAYLHTWERAEGVPTDPCLRGGLSAEEVDAIDKGMSWEEVLRTAGQPTSRVGNEFVYCAVTKKGEQSSARVEFADDGTVTKVTVDKVKPQRKDNPAPPQQADPARGTNPPAPTAGDGHTDHAHAVSTSAASSPVAGIASGAATVVFGMAGLGALGNRALRRRNR